MFGKKNSTDTNSDSEIVNRLLSQAYVEQRRARRWGVFFKLLTFVYLFTILIVMRPDIFSADFDAVKGDGKHTALVRLDGMIAADQPASANALVAGLRGAFKDPQTKGVILAINSPGGSPVQSGYVYDEIRRLRDLHPDTQLYAVISDLGASGGYYIAAAADHIYADKASLVGSIGVTASGFGFVGVLEKFGVERRTFNAGDHKGFLDPFLPLVEEERQFWGEVLKDTHEQFVRVVREGRGDRLKETDDMFSGLVWNGEQALEMGLIDGLGSAGYVARDVIGAEDIVDFTPRLSPLDEFARQMGVTFAEVMLSKGISAMSTTPQLQ